MKQTTGSGNEVSPFKGDVEKLGRDARQKGLVPPGRLSKVHALVVGVGAVGRPVALQLSAMGVPSITLVDFDRVEEVNLGPQGYSPADIGEYKVRVTAAACMRQNPEAKVNAFAERFRATSASEARYRGDKASQPHFAVFLCVDDMDARKNIWEAVRPFASFCVDGRMAAEIIRVLSVDDPATDEAYAHSLHSQGDAFQGQCTGRSTIYSAYVASGLMVGSLVRWLREFPNQPDILFGLPLLEVTALEPEAAPQAHALEEAPVLA